MSIPITRPLPNDSWDTTLPGPPSRNNFGSADLNPSGLLAFASGSSVSVVDSRSLQLVATIPLPPPSSSLAPFVTSVRWIPLPLRRDLLSTEPSSSHLILAAADRHGRIGLLDFRLRSLIFSIDPPDPSFKSGVQDLCWVQARFDSFHLAALSGSSYLSLYNTSSSRCIFKYNASPEYLSCIRRDPFDSRHLCVVGLKGFLLSIKVLGEREDDIALKELQIPTDCTDLLKLEKDAAAAAATTAGGSSSPVSAVYPLYAVRLAFSPHWKNVIYVTFPKELVVFDLKYETTLFSAALPRGCAKFLDVLPDPNQELVYCAHLDGKISIWRRKEGEQIHVMCAMEELMPSIGSPVPSPSVLAVLSQSESTLQNISKIYSNSSIAASDVDFDNPFEFCDDTHLVTKTRIISISDDGKLWNWILTAERIGVMEKDVRNSGNIADVSDDSTNTTNVMSSKDGLATKGSRQSDNINGGRIQLPNSTFGFADVTFKISLVGQLQVLSSTVTMLAVPCPSLIATLSRGGDNPAVTVPLVALGSQSGTIDVIDVSANAVATSFSVHNSTVRGLRWLGNSRLVSFSYTKVNEKTGGYINRLVVTCLRSGLNRTFRVLQKPERAPIRALRTSSSGRYLLILFRDAPVEVWAMTKNPILLRSLALPFTVMEWTLPTVPRPAQKGPSKQSVVSHNDNKAVAPEVAGSSTMASSSDSKAGNSDNSQDELSESFAFALVNGALGVFEVHGRRIRDFRPKWPSSSFVSSDGLITAMAYRLPHVVMGDRSGNIRWWDVTTGQSSSFNTYREGIRRMKFSPVVAGDRSRGRIAVLFNDNTFSVFDLDSPDPLANSLLQPQFPGTLVLELDWLHLRTDKNDPLVLCMAGADSSFRIIEVNINDKKMGSGTLPRKINERFRPMPLSCPVLLPTPHALALRMILQLGVKPSWFNTSGSTIDKRPDFIPGTVSSSGDLRSYLIELPPVGDSVVPELLLKVLEPYRIEGCILDDEKARLYATIVNKGCVARFAFAAATFGEVSEALFWLQLPCAINHLMNKLINKSPQKEPISVPNSDLDDISLLSRITSKGKSTSETGQRDALTQGQLRLMAFEQEDIWERAKERIPWHEKLEGEEAIQNRVHELVTIGNLEGAVSLLLSTSPESPYFYSNALRAVALSSAVSRSLLELAVKVVAANMVRTDRSLSGTHLLCAVGRYQEACSQLQDAGYWTDAANLAASHLKGSDYARVLQRWAGHVFHAEHNIWRALILFVAAGSIQEALAALREAQQPDTAAMFILACREIHAEFIANLVGSVDESGSLINDSAIDLPGLNPANDDVIAVGEYFEEYQRKLVHLCMDDQPFSD
ncbi:WD repeat-containing protein 11-like isoform X2 [Hibiscus syriacus]|uniref:WD repeat-containing protein 11-like isoform X2 n=1 Tax=Hibiscus syriacus TaxID=106335 RepID=A0A6A2W9R0_HIBSY|nr:WD repeat-containing protein 11-like [Hibiscus syriacus]XP_039054926.1 WD repeat-containing protein 11-like [Hibiscus syriacus]KAE8654512.1 WD repeat-containing protein 11-like isoform X2 [Hibiscus syriacus]